MAFGRQNNGMNVYNTIDRQTMYRRYITNYLWDPVAIYSQSDHYYRGKDSFMYCINRIIVQAICIG